MVPKEREVSFASLVADARACRLCPEMCDRTAVMSSLNGPLDARILFIGEAPGRKGADRTHIPFSGDQSGANFDRFLASINLPRNQIFITSAAICNPRSASGANRKPSKRELQNCSPFLQRAFALINPQLVVTLGSVALESIKRIADHDCTLKESAGTIQEWHGRMLVPIYHPSPQVLASHRREAEQLADYRVVAKAIERANIRLHVAA